MKSETMRTIAISVSLVVLATALLVEARPRYIECADSAECGFDHCCVIGQGRYSVPRCVQLGEVGVPCHPEGVEVSRPISKTLQYPDDANVTFTNIYTLMCPCTAGLQCSRSSGTCQDDLSFNGMDNFI